MSTPPALLDSGGEASVDMSLLAQAVNYDDGKPGCVYC